MPISSALGSSALLPAGLGFRNKIINGDMTVNQRGYTSASPVSVSTGSQVYYSADRWYGSGETSQGVYSLGQSTTVPSSETFINSLVATCTTADASLAATDDYEFGQVIEGFNASSLGYGTSAAKQSVLSFWVRSSLIGTYCVALRNSASNRSYIAEYTINVADTWEKKTIYIIGDTTGTWLTNTSLGVSITWALAVGSTYQTAAGSWTAGNYLCSSNQVNWMSSSTSRTFYITGVQLEQNYQPTPFEQRPIGVELALCQRYYWRSASPLTTDSNSRHAHFRRLNAYQMIATGHCAFPVPMRAEPSVSLYNGNGIGYVDAYGAGQESYVIASGEGLSTFGFGIIVKYTNSGLGTTANFAADPASYSYWANIEASAEL